MHASSRRRAGALALAVIGILSLMAAFTPGIAAADPPSDQPCPNSAPWTKWDSESGDEDLADVGSFDWAGKTLNYELLDGAQVEICIKSGNDPFEGAQPPPDSIDDKKAFWTVTGKGSITIGKGISHVAVRIIETGEEPEPEPGEYPVIPVKVWEGAEGDGFSAEITISYETEDASDSKTWTFDGEGVIDDEDPMWVPDTVDPSELTWSESFTVPESEDGEWACVAEGAFEEGQEGVTLEVTNTCDFDEDEEPEIPETPETPQTPQTPETPDTEPDELTEEPPAVEGIVVQVPVEEPAEEPVAASAGAGGVLPRTGLGSLAMAVGGLASLVSGLGLTVVGRRERD